MLCGRSVKVQTKHSDNVQTKDELRPKLLPLPAFMTVTTDLGKSIFKAGLD